MKRSLAILTTLILLAVNSLSVTLRRVLAAPAPDVIITELQTANTSAGEEFIELYNTTDQAIDLADTAHQGKNVWKLQFFSSAKLIIADFKWDPKTSGLTTVSLVHADGSPVVVQPHSYFIVSTVSNGQSYHPGDVDPDFTYGSGHMSDAGGGVQLVDVQGSGSTAIITAHDHLGWFQPAPSSTLPATMYLTPAAGASLQRIAGADVNADYLQADGTLNGFISSEVISPKEAWQPAIDPSVPDETIEPSDDTSTEPDGETSPVPTETVINTGQPNTTAATSINAIQITELLPDPASPLSDDKDEFIELYNSSDQPVQLAGYTLQTGLKYSYSYGLTTQSVEPHAYLTLYSSQTKLSLSNAGGQARVLNAAGLTVSETSPYGAAQPGQSWALLSGQWSWTMTVTPGMSNVATVPVANSSTSATKTVTKAVKAVVKKATTPKKAATTTTKKATTKAATAAQKTDQKSTAGSLKPAPLHKAVLVGVGLIAISYGLYEYRADIRNTVRQFRSNRKNRRAARPQLAGRGSD